MFQDDAITDCYIDRNNFYGLGGDVHPNGPGHMLIARAWMEAFEKHYL